MRKWREEKRDDDSRKRMKDAKKDKWKINIKTHKKQRNTNGNGEKIAENGKKTKSGRKIDGRNKKNW